MSDWGELRPDKNGFFQKVDLPFYGQFAFGNVTQKAIGAFMTAHGALFVGVEGWGAYTFNGFTDASYVAEKFNLQYGGDAANLADWINDQLGTAPDIRQGTYQNSLCRAVKP